MNYLLDTHTLVWSILQVDRIPVPLRAILRDSQNTIAVSVVSFWEISIKYGLGKIRLDGVTPEDFLTEAEKSNFTILTLDPHVASSGHLLPWMGKHRDPFDRILIWQAIQKNMIVVSNDTDFGLYRSLGLKLLW